MSLHTSLWLFLAVHAIGLAVWLSISALNNCLAFGGSEAAVGATMSMAPLRSPPAIDTPLLARAAHSPVLHRIAMLLVLALQIAAAIACWIGCYELVISGDLGAARPWLNVAMTGLATLLFAMHLGGLWFAYWIRQECLQLTHIALLVWTVVVFLLFNMPLISPP